MNGSILQVGERQEERPLLPVDQQKQFKKRQNYKMFSALLITNLLVALSFSSCPGSKVSKGQAPYLSHLGFVKIELPLAVYVPPEEGEAREVAVSLFDPQRRLVLAKAYLHRKKNQRQTVAGDNDLPAVRETVEVPEGELKRLVEGQHSYYLAFPYQAQWGKTNAVRDAYEIRF